MTNFNLLRKEGWATDDLIANRDGRLSTLQADVVRKRMRRYLLMSVIWAIPIPLLALLGAVYGLVTQNEPGYFVFPVLALATFAILPIFVGNRVQVVNSDLRSGRVEVAEGVIDGLFVNNTSRQTRARIGKSVMQCFGSLFDPGWIEGVEYLRAAYADRMPVVAYYLPWSQLFIAAEIGQRPASTSAPAG